MPTKSDTIAANELARKIGSSVQEALKQAKIHDDQHRPIVLHWDIIGFILREEEGLKAELGGVMKAANHVAQSAGQLEDVRAMRGAAGGEGLPAVTGFLPDRRIICGFRPWPWPGPIIKF
jgi:hypothetical protein